MCPETFLTSHQPPATHLEEIHTTVSFGNALVEFYVCPSKIITMLYVIHSFDASLNLWEKMLINTMFVFPLTLLLYFPSLSPWSPLGGSDLPAARLRLH